MGSPLPKIKPLGKRTQGLVGNATRSPPGSKPRSSILPKVLQDERRCPHLFVNRRATRPLCPGPPGNGPHGSDDRRPLVPAAALFNLPDQDQDPGLLLAARATMPGFPACAAPPSWKICRSLLGQRNVMD